MSNTESTSKETGKEKPAKNGSRGGRAPSAPTRKPELSPKQQAFVREYLIDLNATAAYKRAGYKDTQAAEHNASRMMGNDKVKAAIEAALAARAKRTEATADSVLRHWLDIADADPNELIEIRRTCCRHCHGQAFGHQRTAQEMLSARTQWEKAPKQPDSPALPFDELGGEGYDAGKAPRPDCPECFGEGVATPFVKDTRRLSNAARRLYAGVKVTKDGIEIKMRDQDAALLNVAKHLGMFIEKHEHSGTNRGAIPIEIIGIEIHGPPEEPGGSRESVSHPDPASN